VSEVTGRSQAVRLEALLTGRGVLTAGKWREGNPAPKWTAAEQEQIRTSLSDLAIAGQLGRLKPWFQGLADDPFAQPRISLTKLQTRLEAGYGTPGRPYQNIYFSTSLPMVLKTPHQAYVIGPLTQWAKPISTPLGPLDFKASGAMLEIRLNNEKQAKFNLKDFLAGVQQTLNGQASKGWQLKEDAPRLLSGEGDPSIKLAVTSAGGDLERDKNYGWTVYVLLQAEP
jgi:hypothetical protein